MGEVHKPSNSECIYHRQEPLDSGSSGVFPFLPDAAFKERIAFQFGPHYLSHSPKPLARISAAPQGWIFYASLIMQIVT
jgi:hypothetical protein